MDHLKFFNVYSLALKKEAEKFSISLPFEFSDSDTQYILPRNRISNIYRHGVSNTYLVKCCVEDFIAVYYNTNISLSKSLKSKPNLKLCSISNGPCFDYFGLMNAFTSMCTQDKIPVFDFVYIISPVGDWRNSANTMLELMKTYGPIPAAFLCDKVNLIEGSPLVKLNEKLKCALRNSDVILMVKLMNLKTDNVDAVEELNIMSNLKEVFSSLKRDALIIFIDTKPAVGIALKILFQFQGSLLHGPNFLSDHIPPFSDEYSYLKDSYGCFPVIGFRGCIIVWKMDASVPTLNPSRSLTSSCSVTSNSSSLSSSSDILNQSVPDAYKGDVNMLKVSHMLDQSSKALQLELRKRQNSNSGDMPSPNKGTLKNPSRVEKNSPLNKTSVFESSVGSPMIQGKGLSFSSPKKSILSDKNPVNKNIANSAVQGTSLTLNSATSSVPKLDINKVLTDQVNSLATNFNKQCSVSKDVAQNCQNDSLNKPISNVSTLTNSDEVSNNVVVGQIQATRRAKQEDIKMNGEKSSRKVECGTQMDVSNETSAFNANSHIDIQELTNRINRLTSSFENVLAHNINELPVNSLPRNKDFDQNHRSPDQFCSCSCCSTPQCDVYSKRFDHAHNQCVKICRCYSTHHCCQSSMHASCLHCRPTCCSFGHNTVNGNAASPNITIPLQGINSEVLSQILSLLQKDSSGK